MTKEIVTLKRLHLPTVTVGVLKTKKHEFYTLEPPWRLNVKSKSCIPKGWYNLRKHISERFGNCYILNPSPEGRRSILLHCGNHLQDTTGCILIGKSLVMGPGARVRLDSSQAAMTQLREELNEYEYTLVID